MTRRIEYLAKYASKTNMMNNTFFRVLVVKLVSELTTVLLKHM